MMGGNMDKDQVFVEVKMRIDDSKYGQEPEVVSIQAYEGDELDRKFGGYSRESSLDGKTILVTYPVKLTKLRNKKYSKLNAKEPSLDGFEGNLKDNLEVCQSIIDA
jgi:hypothetical protein